MKRKVALLLALVMVMSLLPMNVFGREGHVLNPTNAPEWGFRSFTFAIPASEFAGLRSGPGQVNRQLVLDFELSGGANASDVGFVEGFTFTVATGAGLIVDGDANANNHAFVTALNDWINDTVPADRIVLSGRFGASDGLVLGNTDINPFTTSVWVEQPPDSGNWVDTGVSRAYAHRQAMVDLTGFPFPLEMEGFINITVDPMRAFSPDAAMDITLRTWAGQATTPVNRPLLRHAISGDWSSGVSITSVSVVPMLGIGQLSGIRIRENAVGNLGFAPEGQGNTSIRNSTRSYVRLVAPRGFVWDVGGLQGITGNDGLLLNENAFGRNGRESGRNTDWQSYVQGSTTYGWSVYNPTADYGHFDNENTGRNELILEVILPPRRAGFLGVTTPAEITLRGMSLIPVRGAASTGNVAIDVYVARPAHNGRPDRAPDPIPTGYFRNETNSDPVRGTQTGADLMATARWIQGGSADGWRTRGLVVATLDETNDITITGPSTTPELVSGRLSNGRFVVNDSTGLIDSEYTNKDNRDRWLHGDDHTIRLEELIPGTLFRGLDRFEVWPVQEGVRIVDSRIRMGHTADRGTITVPSVSANDAWVNPTTHGRFVQSITDYNDGLALTFAPRTISDPETQSRARSIDIGVLLSIEPGYEAKYGSDIELEVFRNGQSVGTVKVATATDPIKVEAIGTAPSITRNAFDVLALTPIAGFTVTETAVRALEHNDRLVFSLQATQDGVPISIPSMGEVRLHLGQAEVNAESDMRIEPVGTSAGNTLIAGTVVYRVARESYGTAGVMSFPEAYITGAVIPGIEWHVVVSGPQIAANSAEASYAGHAAGSIWPLGDVDYDGSTALTSRYERRARFFGMPYDAVVLHVGGTAVIDPGNVLHGPGGLSGGRQLFTEATLVDGIQAIIFEVIDPASGTVATMMNPRVFARVAGLTEQWDSEAQTFTFSGVSALGVQTTVVTTLGSTNISINGETFDIATRARQPQFAGRIQPVLRDGRQYVPARVLAETFGIPISFSNRTVTLG